MVLRLRPVMQQSGSVQGKQVLMATKQLSSTTRSTSRYISIESFTRTTYPVHPYCMSAYCMSAYLSVVHNHLICQAAHSFICSLQPSLPCRNPNFDATTLSKS